MTIIEAILDIFRQIAEWISGAFDYVIPIFWEAASSGEGGTLTFMGVLAVAGLAISVVFLLIGVIQRFLHFRG